MPVVAAGTVGGGSDADVFVQWSEDSSGRHRSRFAAFLGVSTRSEGWMGVYT